MKTSDYVMLYEVIRNDEYELPVFAGTIDEVSRYTGRTSKNILSSISNMRKRKKKNGRKNTHLVVVKAGWDTKEITG